MSLFRTRWAALGAAVAITLGGGGIGLVSATNPPNATTFIAITPCRVIDTRPIAEFNVGPKSSPVGPGEEHDVTATGTSGSCTAVPADAAAVSLNVTTLNATLPTFLAIYATGVATPTASSLNPQPAQPPTPNAVTTELSAAGQFTIFNKQGTVDVLADINGYYVDHNHDDRYYTKAQSNDRFASSADVAAALGAKVDVSAVYTRAQVDAEIAAVRVASAPQRLTEGDAFILPPRGCAYVFIYGVGAQADAGQRAGFWIENADGSMPTALDNGVLYRAASISRTSQGGSIGYGEFCSLSVSEKQVPSGWVVKLGPTN